MCTDFLCTFMLPILRAIRPVICFQWTSYPFYLLMLFNPIMASSEVIQRVYRNSITPAQVLLVFGGQFGFYLRYQYGKKFSMKWAIVTTCGFISLWFSREDTIWVVPFLIVSASVIFLKAIIHGFFIMSNAKKSSIHYHFTSSISRITCVSSSDYADKWSCVQQLD